ncbi:MAG: 3-deoxy-7-phosphoheptulonate synthase [Polyangiaceae bacterium]|nr:3-deoxy-7-phosphoheptulonate synthase [Polyangiaceae bacterium]
MTTTSDLNVTQMTSLLAPRALLGELPLAEDLANHVLRAREQIRSVLHGKDGRLIAIVGPCSIHDPASALEYATRLKQLEQELSEDLLVVMRVYFEKPRTALGWKGLINDPHMDESCDIEHGLRIGRKLLLDITALGLPIATEMLDPVTPQYLADAISWVAIGARTTESQTHREMASGLSMPVGFKNATDGSLSVAINGMLSAAHPHRFLGLDRDGRVAIVHARGNADGHLVLRGGNSGPNYSRDHVLGAAQALRAKGLVPRVLIDASHGNSEKDYRRQPAVAKDIAQQVADGSSEVMGVLLESHLVEGTQAIGNGKGLTYGQSVTDGCINFSTTEQVLRELASASQERQRKTRTNAA